LAASWLATGFEIQIGGNEIIVDVNHVSWHREPFKSGQSFSLKEMSSSFHFEHRDNCPNGHWVRFV
jgi:hypothetical protein